MIKIPKIDELDLNRKFNIIYTDIEGWIHSKSNMSLYKLWKLSKQQDFKHLLFSEKIKDWSEIYMCRGDCMYVIREFRATWNNSKTFVTLVCKKCGYKTGYSSRNGKKHRNVYTQKDLDENEKGSIKSYRKR